jgi:hypothetical protein
MQPIPKWALWLGGALVWVAGVGLALFALAGPARAEIAFVPGGARLACPGAAPRALEARGNALYLPATAEALARGCRVEIDFAVKNPAHSARAAAAGVVELVGLKLVRAAFPERLRVNSAGVVLAARPGGLVLSIALETLFGGDRQHGAALILAARTGEGPEAQSHISSTLIIERAEPPAPRAKPT